MWETMSETRCRNRLKQPSPDLAARAWRPSLAKGRLDLEFQIGQGGAGAPAFALAKVLKVGVLRYLLQI